MHVDGHMKILPSLCVALALGAGCFTSTTTATTWTAPAGASWTRPGTVQEVRRIVDRVEGNPAAGAIAGALIGGLLFHGRGPATLFGAATGAAIGAAASQGAAESTTFQLLVRFDDGDYGMFAFRGPPPFAPGDRVVLAPGGLFRP